MKDSMCEAVVGLEDTEALRPLGAALNEQMRRKKVPRRILHFSDGTLEDYSTDDDDDVPDSNNDNQIAQIDPKQMEWFPWMWYQAATAASQTLQVCDHLGESLANFFGITTPKYQYEIDEYHRIVEEEKQVQKKMDMEMGGWVSSSEKDCDAVGDQPCSTQARY